jgi:hypothetical protein
MRSAGAAVLQPADQACASCLGKRAALMLTKGWQWSSKAKPRKVQLTDTPLWLGILTACDMLPHSTCVTAAL